MGATVSTTHNERTRRLQMSVKKLKKSLQAPVGSIKRWAQGKRKAKEEALKKESRLTATSALPTTAELMRRYAATVCRLCGSKVTVEPQDVERWIRSVDQKLLEQAWQDHEYITESSLVFLYVLAKETCTADRIGSVDELKMTVLICLFLGFSYTGNEISYPLKPFLGTANKKAFWDRCMDISMSMSSHMLNLNRDSGYYNKMRDELCCSSATVAPLVR
eukprot:m.10394 g.10394  ORF g.10394 m.10394 type:complete len:219 (+) comp22260_c0_seq1:1191-1847(+)